MRLNSYQVTHQFADWLGVRICYAHDKKIIKEYRAFEKKYGPNGYFNFGNYLRSSQKRLRLVINHPKMPDRLKLGLIRYKKMYGGWLAGW